MDRENVICKHSTLLFSHEEEVNHVSPGQLIEVNIMMLSKINQTWEVQDLMCLLICRNYQLNKRKGKARHDVEREIL